MLFSLEYYATWQVIEFSEFMNIYLYTAWFNSMIILSRMADTSVYTNFLNRLVYDLVILLFAFMPLGVPEFVTIFLNSMKELSSLDL